MLEQALPKGTIILAIVRILLFIPAIAIIIVTETQDGFSDINKLALTLVAFIFTLIAITGAAKLAFISSGTN